MELAQNLAHAATAPLHPLLCSNSKPGSPDFKRGTAASTAEKAPAASRQPAASAAGCTTLLDPLETNPSPQLKVSPLESPTLEHDLSVPFRHSGWADDRRRVHAALVRTSAAPKRLARFALCGSAAWVYRNTKDPEQLIIVADHCHDRFCKPCARSKARRIAESLKSHIASRRVRFCTLTLRHTTADLAATFQRLWDSFRKLRSSPFWKSNVSGGAAFTELKPSRDGIGWHAHLHLLVETAWLDQRTLSHEWHAITKDSFIVDVREIKATAAAVTYVTKYATSPIDAAVYRSAPLLDQAILALGRRRTCSTFGSWRRLRLLPPPEPGLWEAMAPLAEYIDGAKRGYPRCIAVLEKLRLTDAEIRWNEQDPQRYPIPPPPE